MFMKNKQSPVIQMEFLTYLTRNVMEHWMNESKVAAHCVCVCVCVCVCGHVYVVYEDTNLYNDMGMT